MKKFTVLQQVLMGAAALASGYFIYYSFFKTPSPAPAQNTMTMLPAQNNNNTQPSGLSPQEKEELFNAAMGYRGGAAPPQFMLEEFQANQQIALQKIAELGLQAEFDDYVQAQSLLPDRV